MDSRPHFTVNRRLLILLPKQPFLDWPLATDEDTSATLTLPDLSRDPEVYLVPEKAGELPEDVEKWVYKHWGLQALARPVRAPAALLVYG